MTDQERLLVLEAAMINVGPVAKAHPELAKKLIDLGLHLTELGIQKDLTTWLMYVKKQEEAVKQFCDDFIVYRREEQQ